PVAGLFKNSTLAAFFRYIFSIAAEITASVSSGSLWVDSIVPDFFGYKDLVYCLKNKCSVKSSMLAR
ncbi:hypothetical protein, partial [Pseudomonas syringae]|uniref:hypothetical protein n=1 Tax=Pseudomonas syringae TaxID=317 RepID=UPI001955262F